MKKYAFIVLMSFVSTVARCQIHHASLQASGLTCAMCARSVYKSLESIPFIQQIDTDLEGSKFMLTFRKDADVDADQIRKKVEDAGFSVAFLSLTAHFEGVPVRQGQHFLMNGKAYHVLDVGIPVLQGEMDMRVIDKPFLSVKEQKKYAGASDMSCYKTGKAEGDCCLDGGIPPGTRIYHVSM
jgi:copper chaperone CopZ